MWRGTRGRSSKPAQPSSSKRRSYLRTVSRDERTRRAAARIPAAPAARSVPSSTLNFWFWYSSARTRLRQRKRFLPLCLPKPGRREASPHERAEGQPRRVSNQIPEKLPPASITERPQPGRATMCLGRRLLRLRTTPHFAWRSGHGSHHHATFRIAAYGLLVTEQIRFPLGAGGANQAPRARARPALRVAGYTGPTNFGASRPRSQLCAN